MHFERPRPNRRGRIQPMACSEHRAAARSGLSIDRLADEEAQRVPGLEAGQTRPKMAHQVNEPVLINVFPWQVALEQTRVEGVPAKRQQLHDDLARRIELTRRKDRNRDIARGGRANDAWRDPPTHLDRRPPAT